MSTSTATMFTRYQVRLRTRNRLVGGLPKSAKLIEGWLQRNAPAAGLQTHIGVDDATGAEVTAPLSAEQAVAETLAKTRAAEAEQVKAVWTGFAQDGQGLYLEARCVKSMFKEAANVMRALLETSGPTNGRHRDPGKRFKNYRSKLAERVFVEGNRVDLGAKEPDGTEDRPIHVMTPQGPRTALKRYDYVEPRELAFTVKVLKDELVDEDVLRLLLEYAGENGLGADRSQGFGTFDLVELSEIA